MRFQGVSIGLLIAAATFTAQGVQATTCTERVNSACAQLRAGPAAVISTRPDGLLEVNPLTATRDWPAAQRRYLEIGNANQVNLRTRLRPAFEGLRGILLERVSSIPASAPYRAELVRRIQRVRLRVETRERCTRESRSPFVASYDHVATVSICPVLSHLSPEALLTLLAHELGHAVDLCDADLRTVDAARVGARDASYIEGFPFRSIHECTVRARRNTDGSMSIERGGTPPVCGRDGEVYADTVGAQLTAEYLRRRSEAGEPRAGFAADPAQATLSFAAYRMESACDSNPIYRDFYKPLFQTQAARALLACDGVEGATPCADFEVEGTSTSRGEPARPMVAPAAARAVPADY